jgi:hypothetical protein
MPPDDAAPDGRTRLGNLAALLLLLVGAAAALSLDVVRVGDGVKGDESTYVSMALSAAYDGDVSFERRDLERFWAIYDDGPDGIFLKLGREIDWHLNGTFPFLHIETRPESGRERLYYGKAAAYSVAAAPFVRLAGLNGMLLFNVVLLIGAFLAAYHFLATRMAALPALVLALAFLFASVTPLYVVWLTSEIFNFALVAYAYFLWLYKHVAPPASGRWSRWLRSPWSDIVAMILLGIGVYSKPLILPFIAPIVAYRLWRREWRAGLGTGFVAAMAIAVAFGANVAVTGEANYQGGERKTFYRDFPFDSPNATYANRGRDYATDSVETGFADDPGFALRVLRDNVAYFFVGRYTGLVPYYLPGVIALGWALAGWRRLLAPQWLTIGALALAVVGMLIWLPFTWAGGGGAPGNRYFLSLYPALFFVVPPGGTLRVALAAWMGMLFMASQVVHPYYTSTHPWEHAMTGPTKRLPIELTMMNDLPVMVDPGRGHVPFGSDPRLLFYFMDDEAWPDDEGFWTAGASRSEVVVRTGERLRGLTLRVISLQENVIHFDAGAGPLRIDLPRGELVTAFLPAAPQVSRNGYAFVMHVRTERGYVPRLARIDAPFPRFLGAAVRFAPVRAQ